LEVNCVAQVPMSTVMEGLHSLVSELKESL